MKRPNAPALMLAWLLAASLSWPAALSAGDRTVIGVSFDVTDPHYVQRIRDEDLAVLRVRAAEQIATELGERIRFLRFAVDPQADHQIAVKLARPEGTSGSGSTDFGFHFTLSGPDVRDQAVAYAVFRDKSQYSEPVSNVEALALDIGLRMAEIARRNEGDLVGAVLSQVSFTKDAHFTKTPLTGWVIHHDRGAVCMDYDTILRIKSRLPVRQAFMKQKFQARVIEIESTDGSITTSLEEPPDNRFVEHLEAAADQDVSVEQVFVIKYLHSCPDRVQPGNKVTFQEAGS